MHAIVRKATVSLVFSIVAILFLPVLVSAQTQEVISEVVSFDPATDDNDGVVNIANDTIAYNIDSWNPRPEGIFVGGTIQESLMQLNEVGIDTRNYLSVATLMKFDSAFLSNGASQFVVRLPLHITDVEADYPVYLALEIYSVTSSTFSFSGGGLGSAPVIHYTGSLKAECADVANFFAHTDSVYPEPISTTIDHDSWVSENRAYVRIVAPIKTTELYLFVVNTVYPVSVPFQFYWNPSDLCSDNITSSHIAYAWNIAPDQNLFRDYPINADAGWSFVFQEGLGANSRDWSYYYEKYSVIHWHKWLRANAGGPNATGAFTFVMEFRKNSSTPLIYNLTVDAIQPWGSPGGTTIHLLSASYWNTKSAIDVIIAGNPVSNTIVTYSGWVLLEIFLQVQNAGRIQIMLEYDQESPATTPANYFEILRPYSSGLPLYTGYKEQQAWFSPFCSVALANTTYNRTDELVPVTHKGFWSGVGSWWDKHWVDVLGVIMIVGGAILVATGVGAGWGVVLIAGGISLLLYHNIDFIRNAVDHFLGMIIDAIQGIGNWLYKLGMMIWKALQWLVDKIIYYGAILIGMLMIAVALAIFITPLYMEIKILGAIHYMVLGDMERASASMGGALAPVKQGASLIGKV